MTNLIATLLFLGTALFITAPYWWRRSWWKLPDPRVKAQIEERLEDLELASVDASHDAMSALMALEDADEERAHLAEQMQYLAGKMERFGGVLSDPVLPPPIRHNRACESCGTQCVTGTRFCAHCGAMLRQIPSAATPAVDEITRAQIRQKIIRLNLWWWIVVCCAALMSTQSVFAGDPQKVSATIATTVQSAADANPKNSIGTANGAADAMMPQAARGVRATTEATPASSTHIAPPTTTLAPTSTTQPTAPSMASAMQSQMPPHAKIPMGALAGTLQAGDELLRSTPFTVEVRHGEQIVVSVQKQTDAQGKFELHNVLSHPELAYYVLATLDGIAYRSAPIHVKPAENRTGVLLTLMPDTLNAAASSTLVATNANGDAANAGAALGRENPANPGFRPNPTRVASLDLGRIQWMSLTLCGSVFAILVMQRGVYARREREHAR